VQHTKVANHSIKQPARLIDRALLKRKRMGVTRQQHHRGQLRAVIVALGLGGGEGVDVSLRELEHGAREVNAGTHRAAILHAHARAMHHALD
jgi:hypothetical protein